MNDNWVLLEPDTDRAVDGATLLGRAARLAAVLDAWGVKPLDRVAYLLENCIAVFEIGAACQRLGAFAVPINYHATAEETRYVLEDSGARALVTSEALAGVAERASDGIDALRGRVLVVGRAGPASYDDAIDAALPFAEGERPAPGVVVYTSGTTGNPKGVMRPPAAPVRAAAYLALLRDVCKLGTRPVHLVTGPLYHSAPGFFARGALGLGGRAIVPRRFDPEALLAAVERYRVTHLHLVPTMMHRLLALPAQIRSRYDLSSLVAVQHAAAPCPTETKRAMIDWWGPVIDEYYGSTEAGICTYITAPEALERPGSVGRAIAGVELAILDADGDALAAGEIGEVCVATDATRAFDYHGAPDKRRAAARGELFATGDVGYRDEAGYLYLVDRRVDMVISGGVNIYPAEIEAALVVHPAVHDCAVFGVPDDEWGERVHAVVQLEPGASATPAELAAFLEGRLARFKVPRSFELVTSLPREPSGKIYKRKLRDPHWQGRRTAIR